MTAYTSRKFITALLALGSSSVLCWYGRVSDGVYSAVVIATVGSYLAANVAQKAGEKK